MNLTGRWAIGLWSALAVACAGVLVQGPLWGQTSIVTDRSWGRTPTTLTSGVTGTTVVGNYGTTYDIQGHVYTIAESHGRLAAPNNLFHSFERFAVGRGDAAVFTTTTSTLANVITRVSGTSATTINGLLALVPQNGGTPNFFFINPAGVTFGAGAQVDVPGALHVSTANRLKFEDGTIFTAGNGSDSTLSIAAPEAFGFLGTTRAPVAVRVDDGTILTTVGHQFSVIGGDVEVDQGLLMTLGGGDLRVVGVGGGAIDVPLTGALPAVYGRVDVVRNGGLLAVFLAPEDRGDIIVGAGDIRVDGQERADFFTGISAAALSADPSNVGKVTVIASGDLSVKNGARITLEYPGSLTVSVLGNLSLVDGGFIGSESSAASHAAPVTVTAGSIVMDAGRITSFALGEGNGGDLIVSSASGLSLANHSLITSLVRGRGTSGKVRVSVQGALTVSGGAKISTFNLDPKAGSAGPIAVEAQDITIDGGGITGDTLISSHAFENTSGDAGDIHLTARGTLSILNGGIVTSSTQSTGNAGAVTIDAGNIIIDGVDTGIGSDALLGSSGQAGEITLSALQSVSLLSGAQIGSSSYSSGKAGTVKVHAQDVTIDGNGHVTGLFSTSQGSGDAGDVDTTVPGSLRVANGGAILTSTFSPGNAGTVMVDAGNILIDGSATTISSSAGAGSSGMAGNVRVHAAGTLAVLNGASIAASTESQGAAGAVTVDARRVLVDGSLSNIGANADRGSSGQTGNVAIGARDNIKLSNGGSLSIRNAAVAKDPTGSTLLSVSAPRIELESGGQITAESSGSVAASDIRIAFTDRLVLDRGSISTSAKSGDGGDIAIDGNGLVWLDNAFITTSTESGNGGNISIHAGILLLETGFIQANSGGAGMAGGNVSVGVAALIASGSSLSLADPAVLMFQPDAFGYNVIQAAAPSGVSGAIGITAPLLDIAGELSGLEAEMIQTGPLGKDLCRVGAGSSLTPLGRGGLRPSAAGWTRPEAPAAARHAFDTILRGDSDRHVPTLPALADCRY